MKESATTTGSWTCFLAGLIGCALLLAAQPTLSWWPLAWLAPIPWLWLANQPYWMLALRWIPMAHPLQYFSWVFLGTYLAIYLPLLIYLARLGVRVAGWPLWLTAPIAWVACEYAMYHLMTGIALATIPATQIHWPTILQLADIAGPYTIGFVVVLVAATIVTMADKGYPPRTRRRAMLAGGCVLGASIVYGHTRLEEHAPATQSDSPAPLTIALVQGNEPAVWEADPDRDKRVMDQYIKLTYEALDARGGKPFDLIVWPENMFRVELWTFEPDFVAPEAWTVTPEELSASGPKQLAALARTTESPLLVGIDRVHGSMSDGEPEYRSQNSAVVVDRAGAIVDEYAKMHLVPCGEYLPLGWLFPFLYDITPMGMGLTPGTQPIAPAVNGVRVCPNICYESVMPHVVRRQVAELRDRGERPDLLANLTNDSWFRKSCELDMHLACTILRAVECRTPMIIAANGGLSAAIDRTGRVLAITEKQAQQVLTVDIVPGAGNSYYLLIGDWPAVACIATCAVWVGLARLNYKRRASLSP